MLHPASHDFGLSTPALFVLTFDLLCSEMPDLQFVSKIWATTRRLVIRPPFPRLGSLNLRTSKEQAGHHQHCRDQPEIMSEPNPSELPVNPQNAS